MRGLGDVVRELLLRSESAAPGDGKGAGTGGTWIYVVLIGAGVVATLGWLGNFGSVVRTIDSIVVGVGVIAAAFALLSLVKSTKAIRDELACASDSESP